MPLLLYDIDVLKKDAELYHSLRKSVEELIRMAAISADADQIDSGGDEILKLLFSNLQYVSFFVHGEKNRYKDSGVLMERLNKIANYMYVHLDEALTLGSVAEEFNISRYYLAHIIKGAYGMSFKEWLNLIRVDRAEMFLLEADDPISDISFKMGFSSQQYFTRCFKQYFEDTPSRYRKRLREKTIVYRPFDETLCDVRKEFPEFFGDVRRDINGDVIIDLGGKRCRIHILTERGGQMESRTVTTEGGCDKGKALNIGFDCDELAIVIKPFDEQ